MSTGHRFDVSINGRGYQVDYGQYRRRTLPALKEQRDTSDDVGENTLSNVGQWVRSQTDWSHGAGQRHYDLAGSDRARFDSSKNIDVFSTKGEVSICPAIETKSTGTNDNVYCRVVNGAAATFYFSDGNSMKFGDPNVASYSPSSCDMGYAITDWTSDGTDIYCAVGTAAAGPRKVAVSATSGAATIGTFQADVIEYANGRLLAADGARIVELNSSGTVLTFDQTLSGTCVAIKGGPQAIYAAYNQNGQGVLYAITVSATDGSLAYPVPAAVLPVGETFSGPFCLDTFGDLLVAGTSQGCRFGLINSNDTKSVVFGPVIDDGAAAHGTRIVGRFAYWGTKDGDTWKADLTRFSGPLQPAYSRFLAHDSASYGVVQSCDIVGDKMVFTDSLGEVYGEDYGGDLSTSAELTVGIVTFGTVAAKILRAATARWAKEQSAATSGDTDYRQASTGYQASINYRGDAADAPGSVTVTVTDDANVATGMTILASSGEVAYSPSSNDTSSETFEVKLGLVRDASTTSSGPKIERWSLLARPQPSRIEEVIVPLVMQGRVATSHGAGAPAGYETKTEYDLLRSLVTGSTSVTYLEGTRSETVTVEDIEMQPIRYSDDGRWFEGTLLCRLLTIPA